MENKTKPKVSVIVPVYNCEKYIRECVLSIVGSTYKNYEVLLIDDGSTDKSREECEKLENEFSCVSYYWQENSGSAVARNNGMFRATGEFFVFVDGDDRIKSKMIERLVDNLNDDLDIVCCAYEAFDDNGFVCYDFFDSSFLATAPAEKEKLYLQLFNKKSGQTDASAPTAIGVPWAKLYRKSLISDKKIFFNKLLRRKQDNVFNMWVFAEARGIYYFKENLYQYRVDHIKGRTTGAIVLSRQNIREMVTERSCFLNRYPVYNTKKVNCALAIEILDYISAEVCNIIREGKGLVRSLKEIGVATGWEGYSVVLKNDAEGLDKKHKALKSLYRYRLYLPVYLYYRNIIKHQN